MHYFVTGGAGFIGSNFVRTVFKEHPDAKVTVFDKLTYASDESTLNDLKKNKNFNFIKGDVCDKTLLSKAIPENSIIVHFAAETHVDRSIYDAKPFIETNVIGTFNLLEEARKKDIEHFLCISTDEVYGSIENGNFSEKDALTTTNPYSASKAGEDRLAVAYYHSFDLPVTVTRTTNNYGPFQHPEKALPHFIISLLNGKKISLHGDGSHVRDWIFADDNAKAILKVIEKGKLGETYNIGYGNDTSNLKIAEILLDHFNLDKNEYIEFIKDRPGNDKRYALNSSKIRSLGWKPEYSIEDGFPITIDWYKNNSWWWKPFLEKAHSFREDFYNKVCSSNKKELVK